MIESLDQNVGRVCHAIDSLGIANNTIVVFFSDNGGSEPVTDNYPLREGKGAPYEGGTRVPLIIRWPDKVTPGTTSSIPVTGVDFYPTFVNIANGRPASDLDGKDLFLFCRKMNMVVIYIGISPLIYNPIKKREKLESYSLFQHSFGRLEINLLL